MSKSGVESEAAPEAGPDAGSAAGSEAGAFEQPSYAQWEQAAQTAARVESLADLATVSYEGLVINPLYSPDNSLDNAPNNAPATERFDSTDGQADGADAGAGTGSVGAGADDASAGVGSAGAGANASGWQIRSSVDLDIDVPDLKAAAAELAAGANALTLLSGTGISGKSVWAEMLADEPQKAQAIIAQLLELGGDTPTPLYLPFGSSLQTAISFAQCWLAALPSIGAASRSVEEGSSQASCNLGLDPIGVAFAKQVDRQPGRQLDAELAETELAEIANFLPSITGETAAGMRMLSLDGTAYNQAGAGDVTELAALLANAVHCLRALTDQALTAKSHLSFADFVRQIEFTITASADVFAVVTKCRALRRCWAQILQACGHPELMASMSLHVSVSPAMMSSAEPWVNVLRSTTACLAASIGGANAVTVPPFDSYDPSAGAARTGAASAGAASATTELSRRIARNTQLILQNESQINAVIDPANGSWFVEELTDQLANSAWQRFTQIEATGGIVSEIQRGPAESALYKDIAETNSRRAHAIATGQQVLVGVNQFAHLDKSQADEAGEQASGQQMAGEQLVGERLVGQRWAEPFERLRANGASDPTARVFVAELNKPKLNKPGSGGSGQGKSGTTKAGTTTAGTNFAEGFFALGGITAVMAEPGAGESGTGEFGYGSPADVVAAFRDSNASLACICLAGESASETNDGETSAETLVEQTAAELRAAGALRVYLVGAASAGRKNAVNAGRKRVTDAEQKGAINSKSNEVGVEVIFPGCDAVAVLNDAYAALAQQESQ